LNDLVWRDFSHLGIEGFIVLCVTFVGSENGATSLGFPVLDVEENA